MNRNQLLMWAVVLLAITNVATIATIFYNNKQKNKAIDNIAINTAAGLNMLNGRFFRQTLGFNEAQMDSFRRVNQVFRPHAMDLTYRVDSLKNEMFILLQNTTPDTLQLNIMAKEIGELHGKLKYETYHFYLNIKEICSPAQSLQLQKAFEPLFKTENENKQNMHRRRGINNY